ncbi:hypothetical protein P7C73_g1686, partial [Tremellales sp. Uapishka_1]
MNLQPYFDTLFESPAESSTSASTKSLDQYWTELITDFEKTKFVLPITLLIVTDSIVSPTSNDHEAVQFEETPWPSILDRFGVEGREEDVFTDIYEEEKPDAELVERVKRHLTTASTYTSLLSLLRSSRSNEDIQLELVELMGFEGDGLSLVEEMLRPGARELFTDEAKEWKVGFFMGGEYLEGSRVYLRDRQASKKSSTATASKPSTYLPSSRMTVNGKTKGKGKQAFDLQDMIGSAKDIERRIQEQLTREKPMFTEEGLKTAPKEVFPHVYMSGSSATGLMSQGGKLALPIGTIREAYDIFDEVIVPPMNAIPPKSTERPVLITALSPLARGCFPKYTSLNRMQSIVQPTAMNTNENMLICAPTGAGKTDVALMSILRVIQSHTLPGPSNHPSGFTINRDAFKVIYVAPMKALAAEITRKFGKRLAWLNIKVRELTGDMQLTRQEIAETQIIVTTPEKWDVVTRKPTGEGELASKVQLLIIDEVHLLNEDRGAVIETIVARTLRQVESSQSLIRIVGLSATLPNYVDVSDFLRVNRYQGLFFFDSSFRPVPLEQHFIGVRGKPRSSAAIKNMDQVVFQKVSELVREGHQVMVFVHARKETVKTAQKLKEMAQEEGTLEFFDTTLHPKYQFYRREIGMSRNKEMKELFDSGLGIHHAGMLRSDRSMMERMFEDNAIKVLCCTSTLAWGVNLPAHAVVIKGTQVYDSGKGAFVDLSVLDVLQIFGRAGRPGYETSGEGYICTTQDKLDHYLDAIMAQHPIESKFIPGMVDSLNAEISLGTIASVPDAIQWIGYTYLFVRMRREPFVYGMSHDEPKDDPQLGNKRNQLVTQAARQLASAKMIRFDEINNGFVISDLGRIAAKYYLRYQTVEIFNTMFNAKMKNADIFAMLSQSTEFEQIKVRDNEIDELTNMMSSENCPLEVKNAGRIIRALLEIALSRNWANCAGLLIDLSKAIEKRMWPFDHPLIQVTTLQRETVFNLRRWAEHTTIPELREMSATELGQLVHMNEHHGSALHSAAMMFPTVTISHSLRPLSHDLLQISVHITPSMTWNTKLSGTSEPFYVWVEDEEGLLILQWRSVLLRPTTETLDIDFVIPFSADQAGSSISVVCVSDRWMGSEEQSYVSLGDLIMPKMAEDHTTLLDIPYLNIACLGDKALENAYRPYISTLNSIQSQVFWSVYHTFSNVLLSAPISSGKSFLGEMAIWHAFRHDQEAKVLVVVPHTNAIRETVSRLRSVCPRSKDLQISGLYKESELKANRGILVTTPRFLLRIENTAFYDHVRQLSLVIFEDLHLLDELYELCIAKALSAARPARVRILGITSSLNDASDLAAWLGVDPQFRYNFMPRDRGTPIIVSLKTFTIPHSATLLKTMIKPAYDILKTSTGNAILFAPSNSACRSIAADMVTQSGTEMDLNGFLQASRADVEPLLQQLKDEGLFEPLLYGMGYILPGMAPSDLGLVLELFASGILKALIVSRETCWNLPIQSEVVILMGTQYLNRNRQVEGYSRTELVKMQGFAIGQSVNGGRMFVMCQAEQAMSISRVLNDGLPLESKLPLVLKRIEGLDSREAGAALEKMMKPRNPPPPFQPNRPKVADLRKRDMMDWLGWTFLGKRIASNPSYYDLNRESLDDDLSRLIDAFFVEEKVVVPKKEKAKAKDQDGEKSSRVAVEAVGENKVDREDREMMETNKTLKGEDINIFEIEEIEVGDADGEAL